MKTSILILSAITMLSLRLCAESGSYTDQLKKLKETSTPDAAQKFIADSYAARNGEPDYYVASANYWWNVSLEPSITTKPATGEDMVVADQKSGKPVGSISTIGVAHPEIPQKAITLLQEGFKKFPLRLDIGAGLAYMLREQEEQKQYCETLEVVLQSAVAHPADVRWKNGGPLPGPAKEFLPEMLQDYTAGFYRLETKEGDQLCEELCKAIIKAYPDHAYAYNVLAALSSAHKDEKACLQYLLTALEKAPHDTLIQLNLGDAYRRAGDGRNARHYYEAVLASNPPDDVRRQAEKAISTLK